MQGLYCILKVSIIFNLRNTHNVNTICFDHMPALCTENKHQACFICVFCMNKSVAIRHFTEVDDKNNFMYGCGVEYGLCRMKDVSQEINITITILISCIQ